MRARAVFVKNGVFSSRDGCVVVVNVTRPEIHAFLSFSFVVSEVETALAEKDKGLECTPRRGWKGRDKDDMPTREFIAFLTDGTWRM